MNAPGKGLLKVTGILLIIFAGINILAVIGLGALAASLGTSGLIVVLAVLVSCILAALQLIAGILGIKNCDKPEKAQVNFILGILLILAIIINQAVVVVMGSFVWWSSLIGFVLPVLYLVGALKNKEVSGTGVEGGSIIDQAKDAFGDAQADIQSGAIVDEAKAAATDAVAGAKEIGGQAVDAGKEVVDKVADMVDGNKDN